MNNGWTPERRQKQAEAIRQWQPWTKSTGPRSPDGKTQSARNADKGGQWRKERAFIKMMRQELREHQEILEEIIDYAQILDREAP